MYCMARKDAEGIAESLSASGFKALPYHAGMDAEARRLTQERFTRDEAPIIVATIAFGMGIDKPGRAACRPLRPPALHRGVLPGDGPRGAGWPAERDASCSIPTGDKFKQEHFVRQIEDPVERDHAQRMLAQIIEFGEFARMQARLSAGLLRRSMGRGELRGLRQLPVPGRRIRRH